MRVLTTVGLLLVLAFGATGCNNNQAKAESLAQQAVDTMNALGDGYEAGDKAAIKTAISRLTALSKESNEVKVTTEQKKAIEEKFKPMLEAATKKMLASITKAMTSGKFTQAEMMELGQQMAAAGTAMKK